MSVRFFFCCQNPYLHVRESTVRKQKKRKGNMCSQALFPVSFWSWAETEQQTAMGKQQLLPHKKRPFYRARVVLRSLYWSLAHSFERKREIVGFPLSRTQRRTLRKGTCAQCRWIRFESRYRRKKKNKYEIHKRKEKEWNKEKKNVTDISLTNKKKKKKTLREKNVRIADSASCHEHHNTTTNR